VRPILLLTLLATPALALASGHTGVATPRTGPELSDIALFVMAALGIWFTRRHLRKRARNAHSDKD